MFYKAGGDLTPAELAARRGGFRPRARDAQDFHALLSILTGAQRGWLREALATVAPAHPWLPRLTV